MLVGGGGGSVDKMNLKNYERDHTTFPRLMQQGPLGISDAKDFFFVFFMERIS